MIIFMVMFGSSGILNLLKIFFKMNKGVGKVVLNTFSYLHLMTMFNLIYATYVRYSHSGRVCSCDYIGDYSDDAMELLQGNCMKFGGFFMEF